MGMNFRKLILSVFVVCHLIALPLYLLPSSQWSDLLLAPFLPYISFFGLEQNWSVFTPPPQWNARISALIEFDDGSTKTWEFPQMDKLCLVEKMFSERYRKWSSDYVADPRQAIIWPDTAKYVARINTSPGKRPIAVSFVRKATPINLPNKPISSESEETQIFFTQEFVVPGDDP